MALIPFAVKRLITPDGNDPKIKARIGILHVDAGNAYSLYNLFLNNQRAGGTKIESHGHVRKDGSMEQYRDTAYEADANYEANPFALSFETQGYGPGLWTPEQIATIKRLMLWARDEHGIPLRKVTSWDDPLGGWGYHTQFGAPGRWTPIAKSCPGPDRIKQFNEVLVPWMNTQGHPAAGVDAPVVRDLKAVAQKRSVSLVLIARIALRAAAKTHHGSELSKIDSALHHLSGVDSKIHLGVLRDLKALRAEHDLSLAYLARVALREARDNRTGVTLEKIKSALHVLQGVDSPS